MTPLTPGDLAAIVARAAAVLPDGAWDGYEGKSAIAVVTEDVSALLAHLVALDSSHAADVKAAVRAETVRCAAVCREVAAWQRGYGNVAGRCAAEICAEAIERGAAGR